MPRRNYAGAPPPSSPNPETEIRLALLRRGYIPLPSVGKQCKMRNWPRVGKPGETPVNEAFIRHIGRSALYTGSGIRIDRAIIVIDVDTDIDALAGLLWDEIKRQLPEFVRDAVVRHSDGASFALFGRCSSNIKGGQPSTAPNHASIARLGTARYKVDGKGRNHAVEVFGPEATKFIAVSGPHTIKNGVVTRRYGFDGKALWEVDYKDLPEIHDTQVAPLLKALEPIIASFPGMVRTQPERLADRGFDKVYDLDEDMIVHMEDGTQETLRSLGQRLAGGGYEKCYANLWDPASTTADRCHVKVGGFGVCIIDFKLEQTHYLADKKTDPLVLTRLADRLRELGEK